MRGYILLKLKGNHTQDEIWDLIQSIEEIKDIEYVSHIIGLYDFIATVDTHSTLDAVAESFRKQSIFDQVITLKENNIFKKHRELKGLTLLEKLR